MSARLYDEKKASGASRLFHAIVVIGASLGCGGGTSDGVRDAGADASSDDAAAPNDSAFDATDAAATGDVARAPQSYCDCARPGTFRCSACESGKTPVHGRCADSAGIGCICDESVAIGAPSDCPRPEQYVCAYSPDSDASTMGYGFFVNDWYAFADCTCDSTRPLNSSECTSEMEYFTCAIDDVCSSGGPGGTSARVRYACACLPPATPIA